MQISGETQKVIGALPFESFVGDYFWGAVLPASVILPQVPANTLALFRFIIASVALGIFISQSSRVQSIARYDIQWFIRYCRFNVLQTRGSRWQVLQTLLFM